ncbi:MAG: ParB/RepB/Spo0J family partition protein [Candidatus Lokiarchaeota archaeon]|nr:ParB/RepB/Spo0J family partition protein [Candidatus Lokiarchaeota archaeon]MBD3341016.1 ParB/RepB/Spo0J family partition protein [Candidatus Lokiarchaeota archaeon]
MEDCLKKISNIEFLNINEIKIEEKERIRTGTGTNISDLKKSIDELGLFHPIIVNQKKKLIAGYRRLKACKELGWKNVPAIKRMDLDKLQELSVEVEENLRRKDLAPYEIDIAIAKWKRIYEELHPETKHLAHVRKSNRDEKGRIQSRKVMFINEEESSSSSETENLKNKKSSAERFTKVAAKCTKLSERTIRNRARVGEAILSNKYDSKVVDLYKENQITHTQMLDIDKGKNKKKEEKKVKDKIESKETNFCRDCNNAKISCCPDCGNKIIVCDKGNLVVKGFNSEACNDFKK